LWIDADDEESQSTFACGSNGKKQSSLADIPIICNLKIPDELRRQRTIFASKTVGESFLIKSKKCGK
jgi:hypothetical protein